MAQEMRCKGVGLDAAIDISLLETQVSHLT